MRDTLVKCLATGLYSGYLRPFPGTWGTIPAWVIACLLIGNHGAILLLVTIAAIVLSVWVSGLAEVLYGHDSRRIVIDEWAGMFTALLFVPHSLTACVLAFLAFRFFDVVKLPPVGSLERLPRGWGVTMDDVAAGLYANITVRLILFVAERVFHYPVTGN
ncbi:MAG TPA: phosphatidylglycerophosphatase A [Acidobacteriota bacterium]|nr:phosphatidylglycerophosphatase A [Acidobacteriota bacterium]